MNSFKKVLLVFTMSIVGFVMCSPLREKAENTCDVSIYAAAGTRVATEEICDLFEEENNCKVFRNYTSSGTLARQIANGAPCDIYVSANRQWIDYLLKADILEPASVHTIAGNSLVIIAPVGSRMKAPSFTKEFDIAAVTPGKIAIGDPAYVPVGKYTREAFSAIGWYSRLKDKAIMAKDVTAVMHYVELGTCDWGVVYYTEALQSTKVKIVAEVPLKLHKPIAFYVADIIDRNRNGKGLSEMLRNGTGKSVFARKGFRVQE